MTNNIPHRNKHKAWTSSITKTTHQGTYNKLNTLIGQLGHVAIIIRCLLHFLSRLHALLFFYTTWRSVKLLPKHISDLHLVLVFLDRTNTETSTNCMSYRSPLHYYRAYTCPWGIEGYNSNERAWRWELPPHLRWCATLNMLKFVATVIGPWIDLIEQILPPLSCIVSITDSTTTNGWQQKPNFDVDNKEEKATRIGCKILLTWEHSTKTKSKYTVNSFKGSQWR